MKYIEIFPSTRFAWIFEVIIAVVLTAVVMLNRIDNSWVLLFTAIMLGWFMYSLFISKDVWRKKN